MQGLSIIPIFFFFLMIMILVFIVSILYTEKVYDSVQEALTPYATSINATGTFYRQINVALKPEMELESLMITSFSISHGKHSKTYFRITGSSHPGSAYALELKDEPLFGFITKRLFGTVDVEIGDPAIDNRFLIKTNNPEVTKTLFSDPDFRRYIFSIGPIRVFKIIPGAPVYLLAEVNFNKNSALSAIYAMENALRIIAPERKEEIKRERYRFTEEIVPKEKVPMHLPQRPTERIIPRVDEEEHKAKVEAEMSIQPPTASTTELKQAFDFVKLYASEIKFLPYEQQFNQVIVTPWFSDVDQIKFGLSIPMQITGIENLAFPVESDIWIEISLSGYMPKSRYPSTEELKKAIYIKSNLKNIDKELSYRYSLLQHIISIKGLRIFRVEIADSQIKLFISCDLNAENIKPAFLAIKEMSWVIKASIL